MRLVYAAQHRSQLRKKSLGQLDIPAIYAVYSRFSFAAVVSYTINRETSLAIAEVGADKRSASEHIVPV